MSVRSIVRKPNQHQNIWMEQFPKDKDGVIYVRQSSMAQVEQNIHSFEAQTEKFVEYFRNMGCTGQITIIPDDEGVSGTVDIHKRVGMSKLMKLIEQEQVGWIAAVHVNRFTRDKYGIDPGILIQACEKHNVWVATLRMNFNFRDDYSQRVFKIEAEEAARHLEWMKLILGGGKRAASDRGYYDGRSLAPGYIVDRSDEKRKKLTPYLPHVVGTQWVFQRFFELDGEFWRLRREVHEKDYLYPPFEAWVEKENVKKFTVKQITEGPFAGYYKPTETGLRYMLTNPVYIGWWIPLDGGVVYNNHEPLISEELFWFAFNRLSSHDIHGNPIKTQHVVRYGKAEGILKKLLFSEDGLPYYATTRSGGTQIYICHMKSPPMKFYRHSISIDVLDSIFLERFFERVANWEGEVNWQDKIEQYRKAEDERKKGIQRSIAQAERQRKEMSDQLTDPDLPKTKRMKIDYAQRIAGLEQKIEQLQAELAQSEHPELLEEQVQYELYTLLPRIVEEWDKLPYASRLRFVSALTRKVVLSRPAPSWITIEIHWKRTDWGIDTKHFMREVSDSHTWSEEDEVLLREHYADAEVFDLLQLFPTRSWVAIRQHAYKLGLTRELLPKTGIARQYEHVSLADADFAAQLGLVSIEKETIWC